ncbi:glycosyltransferase family 4 protein [Deinococcus caeni]|uniref:D-inositol-3-phosphate glycosyltransferase n=1 Tax=Deinococcus caeni TaxID=569127 RepID=A0ABP9UEY8_9DEIO
MNYNDKYEIMISAFALDPNKGTEPGNGWRWAYGMLDHFAHVHVLTRSDNRKGVENFLEKNTTVNVSNLTIHYIDTKKIPIGGSYVLWQIDAFKKAKKIIRNSNIKLIHHVTYGSLQGGSFLWKMQTPFIFGPVGGGQTSPFKMRQIFGKKQIAEGIRTIVTRVIHISPVHRALARWASMVLTTNSDTYKIVNKLGGRNIRMFLDSGIDEDLILRGVKEPSHNLKILWVGRLMPRKGILLAVESLSILKKHVNFEATIVGDGEQLQEAKNLADRLGILDKISFLGQIDHDKVFDMYKEHDILLFTSVRDSFGSQVLEALSQGVPVVCLDHQGVADFLTEEISFKAEIGNYRETVENLTGAILRYASQSSEEKKIMVKDCISFSMQHTWNKRIEDMLKIYSDIL